MKNFILLFIINLTSYICLAQELKDSNSGCDSLCNIACNQILNNNELKVFQDSIESIIRNKEEKILSLRDSIVMLNSRLLFADTIIARLSNDCLRKKYDQDLVNDAINIFSQMYSQELQDRLSPVKQLLQNYGLYYEEIIVILQTAQNNSDLTIPSIGKQTANSYISKIKNTQYYQKYYKRNWNIPFLEKLIDKSIKSLQEYDPMSMNGITLIDFK